MSGTDERFSVAAMDKLTLKTSYPHRLSTDHTSIILYNFLWSAAVLGSGETTARIRHWFCNSSELTNYDAIIFRSGTWFDVVTAQMRNFLDQTGPLWKD